jgi:hypothetical protein
VGNTTAWKEGLEPRKEGKHLVIPAPWQHAEALQTELRKAGVRTTLCCDPQEMGAYLEVWPGQDEGQVREALRRLAG